MKIKLEIEIDVDVKEIFSQIPEGLFNSESDMKTEKDEYEYLIEQIEHILRKAHTSVLMSKIDMLAKSPEMIKYSEHHYKVEEQIAEQLSNFKIIK
jgi:hypothetical protein